MLNITYLENGNILLNSDKIQDLLGNFSAFSSLKIEASINCCPNLFIGIWPMPLNADDKIEYGIDGILIKKPFFGLTGPNDVLKDGVYHFNVKIFTDANTYNYEENCAFVDVTYKCKVAKYIDNLLDKNEDGEVSTNVHVLHYALVNGSNCACNCEAMCDVFKELTKLILPLQNQDCGC